MNDLESLLKPQKPGRKKKRADRPVILIPDCDSASELAATNDEICECLQAKPKLLTLRFMGISRMSVDAALVLHDTLENRPAGTRLLTDARSPICGAGVALWLLGDERRIRPTAWLFFRGPRGKGERPPLPPWLEGEEWRGRDEPFGPDLAEMDYRTILRLIARYLPVELLAGQPVTPHLLAEYCLIGGAGLSDSAESREPGVAPNPSKAGSTVPMRGVANDRSEQPPS